MLHAYVFLAALQSLSDILHTAHGYASYVHFDESSFYAVLLATVAFDDCGLKGDAFETGQLECHISGSGVQIGHRDRCGKSDGPRCTRSERSERVSRPRPPVAR